MLGHNVQVRCVGHDHLRALSAALQDDALQVRLGRIAEEVAADFGGAGEGDHVHVRMPADGLPGCFAQARDHVEHARRNAGLGGQFGHPQGAQRGLLGRLEHHAVAGGQGGADLPGRHLGGEVPGNHRAHHAHRLAQDQGQVVCGRGGHLAVNLVDRLRVPADAMNRVGHVAVDAIADRLACFQAVQQGQLAQVGLQAVGEGQQRFLAIHRTHLRPNAALECLAGRADGQIHVGRIAGGDIGQLFAIGRVFRGERAAALGGLEFPPDEGLGAIRQTGHGLGNGLRFKCQAHGSSPF